MVYHWTARSLPLAHSISCLNNNQVAIIMEGEIKKCPKCRNSFVCNSININKCGCMAVPLNNQTRQLISERYDGCLCVNCLKEMVKLSDG